MKNNESKSGSVRLITIMNLVLIIIAMMASLNVKYKDVQIAKQNKVEETIIEIAKVEENKNNETNKEMVTSRSLTESRRTEEQENVAGNEEQTQQEEPAKEQEQVAEDTAKVEEIQVQEEVKEVVPEVVYTKIEDVKISQNMDLTVRTGLSREDFITLIAGVKADTSGFFEENAGLIYDLCEKYEINEIFFCGLISAESGWNIASNHRRTYNYISLMSNGKLIQYSSVENGLETAAKKLHDNYLSPSGRFYHGKTLSGVKKCFCPASDTWVSLVYGRMKQIV